MGKAKKKFKYEDWAGDPSVFDDPAKMDEYFAKLAAEGELGDTRTYEPAVKESQPVGQRRFTTKQTPHLNNTAISKDPMADAINRAAEKISNGINAITRAASEVAANAGKMSPPKTAPQQPAETATPSPRDEMRDIYNIGSFMRVSVAKSRGVKYIAIDDYSGTSISVPVVEKEVLKRTNNWFSLDEPSSPVDLIALLYLMTRLRMRPDYIGTVQEIVSLAKDNGWTVEQISNFVMVWTHEDCVDEDYNNFELAMYYAGQDTIGQFRRAIEELSFKYDTPILYMLMKLLPSTDTVMDYYGPDILPFLEIRVKETGRYIDTIAPIIDNLNRLMKSDQIIHPDLYGIMDIDDYELSDSEDYVVTEDVIKVHTALPEVIFASNIEIMQHVMRSTESDPDLYPQQQEYDTQDMGDGEIGVVNTDGPGGQIELTEEELNDLLGTSSSEAVNEPAGGGASNDNESFRGEDSIRNPANETDPGTAEQVIHATPKSNGAHTKHSTERDQANVDSRYVDHEPIGNNLGSILKANGLLPEQETQEGKVSSGSASEDVRTEEEKEEAQKTQEEQRKESGGETTGQQRQEAETRTDSEVTSGQVDDNSQWSIPVRTVGR